MRLPDGLPGKKEYDYDEGDIKEWRAWAVKKGYKDSSIPQLMTFAQKGLGPSVISQIVTASQPSTAKIDASKGANRTPAERNIVNISQTPASTPSIGIALDANKTASNSYEKTSVASTWLLLMCGLVIAAAALVLLMIRKR